MFQCIFGQQFIGDTNTKLTLMYYIGIRENRNNKHLMNYF